VLVWNPYEFIECLGVLPETDEDETYHSFEVKKDGLRLHLSVFQYACDIYVDLYREGIDAPAFSAKLLECEGARYISDRDGERLEFAPAKSFVNRYDGESLISYGVRVAVNPHIKVELF